MRGGGIVSGAAHGPCPFCGGRPYLSHFVAGEGSPIKGWGFAARCVACGATGPQAWSGSEAEADEQAGLEASERRAWELWDRRAEDAVEGLDEGRYRRVCDLLDQALETMSEWGT